MQLLHVGHGEGPEAISVVLGAELVRISGWSDPG